MKILSQMFALILLAALFAASVTSAAQVNLTWADQSNNESGFTVERAVGAGAFQPIANVGPNVAAYQDTSAAVETTYSYRVCAFNSGGKSAYSNTATVTTPSAPPAAPGSLEGTPPPAYTPPTPTVTLNAGESLTVVASAEPRTPVEEAN